jgi:anti-sigma regulatory factor (Ser/Thr protein kinase)
MKFKLDEQADPVTQLVEEMEAALEEQSLPPQVIYAANLCVEELLVNSIKHGYGGVAAPDIEVDVQVTPEALVIEVSDSAPPFDPTSDSAEPDVDAELDERSIGGLGVHLVKKRTDEMTYRRDGDRNRIRLVKRIPSSSRPTAVE